MRPLLLIVFAVLGARPMDPVQARLTQLGSMQTRSLEETIECQKVVKIFGGQDYEARRFDRASQQLRDEARAKDSIKSADKIEVVEEGDNIVIQSASPETISTNSQLRRPGTTATDSRRASPSGPTSSVRTTPPFSLACSPANRHPAASACAMARC